ncbi:MAG: hypothetical protein JO251_11065 [Verrucomicrobia bacterium]|nr:hypothetical protein [Verrucomicrobiota bacterium]
MEAAKHGLVQIRSSEIVLVVVLVLVLDLWDFGAEKRARPFGSCPFRSSWTDMLYLSKHR